MFKRIISLLLVVLMLSVPVAAADGIEMLPEEEFFDDAGSAETLSEGLGITEEQYETLKTIVYTATRNYESSCNISSLSIPYNDTTSSAINLIVRKGDPLTFHIDQIGLSRTWHGSTLVFEKLYFTYKYTRDVYESMKSEMIAVADEMLEGVEGNDALSDVQKALVLHDRLALHCEYDVENLEAGTTTADDYTMYGAMIVKKCVCEAYTKAYSYLLDRVGIDNYYCESYQLGHIWNIVYIDGEKYHVDVTWDDTIYDVTGRVAHDYFLCSTNKLISDELHEADDFDTTPDSTLYDDGLWSGVRTAFTLLGNSMYYVEKSTGNFNKWSGDDVTTLSTITARWRASNGWYYAGCFSCVTADGKYVYYSLPRSIVRYDVKTGTTSVVYEYAPTGDMSDFYIYGIKAEDMTFTVDVFNSPLFEATTKADYEFTVPYTHPTMRGDVNGDNATDSKDVSLLKKYVAGANISGLAFFISNADVNRDGSVDMQDVKALKRIIAG